MGWRMLMVIRPEAGKDHQVFDRTHQGFRFASSRVNEAEVVFIILLLSILIRDETGVDPISVL